MWGREVWRTTYGVAQWPGSSEARRRTITAVSGATGMSRSSTWGLARWQNAMLRKTLNAARSVTPQPRPGARNKQHLTPLTGR